MRSPHRHRRRELVQDPSHEDILLHFEYGVAAARGTRRKLRAPRRRRRSPITSLKFQPWEASKQPIHQQSTAQTQQSFRATVNGGRRSPPMVMETNQPLI